MSTEKSKESVENKNMICLLSFVQYFLYDIPTPTTYLSYLRSIIDSYVYLWPPIYSGTLFPQWSEKSTSFFFPPSTLKTTIPISFLFLHEASRYLNKVRTPKYSNR